MNNREFNQQRLNSAVARFQALTSARDTLEREGVYYHSDEWADAIKRITLYRDDAQRELDRTETPIIVIHDLPNVD
jgi:hypothetical protein